MRILGILVAFALGLTLSGCVAVKPVIVPDIVGMSASEGRVTLEEAGFEVELEADGWVIIESNWTVDTQFPAAGANKAHGSTVIMKVSKHQDAEEPEETEVPQEIDQPAGSPVTDSEILGAFQEFFTERASSNVMYAKAITGLVFENGVVRVTFDAASAGLDQATFDSYAGEFNLPQFVATPIAFNDEVGNRIRPVVDRIETVRTDGSSLGALDRAGILALNGLSE